MKHRRLAEYFKGRPGYNDFINMPMPIYHTFEYIMFMEEKQRSKIEEAKAEQERIKAEAEARREKQGKVDEHKEVNVRKILAQRAADQKAQQIIDNKEKKDLKVSTKDISQMSTEALTSLISNISIQDLEDELDM